MGGALALWTVAMVGCSRGEQPATSAPAAGLEAPVKESPIPEAKSAIPARQFAQKVWVIGFDGVDPDWLKVWVDQGKLPHFKKLMEEGSFRPLTSTNPPQSPVAWSSFATGANPGVHGIFDFIRRDPKTYLPAVSAGDVEGATFDPDGSLRSPPRGVNGRTGESFWKYAADQGVVTTALNVPYSFPAESMAHGAALSGLGTPDLRGTNSTFTFFSTALTLEEATKGTSGGRLIQLIGAGPVYQASFDGPMGPRERATVPIEFKLEPDKKSVTITLSGQSETVQTQTWSNWFDYRFEVTPKYTVRAIGRFYVGSISPLEVFMYPPNIHPDEPWVPISSPAAYSARLKERYGLFKTVGWTHDTSGLNSEKIGDRPWMEDLNHAMDRLTAIGLGELEQDPESLFIWVETATDRVAHMFTRATDKKSPRYDKNLVKELGGDPILLTYQRADAALGKVLERVTPDTTLLVISDHGFHTYNRGLHINAWLLENGYLVLQPEKARGASTNLFNAVDWSRTKAYALGTGQIYVNLAGREGQGILTAAEYGPLVEEISRKLETLKDDKSGTLLVSKVYKRDEIYKGRRFDDAPDMQVAFREGWRTSGETMLGGIPEGLFADNTKKWSGDHAASDVADTAGILLSNRKIGIEDPAIIDIAPTVLSIFGLKKPSEMEGRDLFNGAFTLPAVDGAVPAK